MNPKLIVIDGKTYHSVDEMPPDIRQKYEQAIRSLGDANDNHIPDMLENMNLFTDKNRNGVPDALENVAAGQTIVSSMKVIVDGKEFNDIENLPPEIRARYDEAMRRLDENQNGIRDFAEGTTNITNQTADVSTSFGTETPRHSAPLPVSPTIEPDTSQGRALALIGLFGLLLCAAGAAGVWYYFIR
jgi:hypothetical protein